MFRIIAMVIVASVLFGSPAHTKRPLVGTKEKLTLNDLLKSKGYAVKFEFDAPTPLSAPADLYNYEERRTAMGNETSEEPPTQGIGEILAEEASFQAYRSNGHETRSGTSTEGHMCNQITGVPSHLTFITKYRYYRKYTHAYGIPIVSSYRVRDAALKRACYVVRFLFADRQILRRYMYKYFGRVGIMAINEGTTSIPEHSHLGKWWDSRARGLGGTLNIPISTAGEENLLCLRGDRYPREDIFLHEFSHGIHGIAINGGGIPGWHRRLQSAYYNANRRGLWRNTYAMSTVDEYFAEGTQSYFNVNDYSPTPNGISGPINTRTKLKSYDPTLYNLIREVFPCLNIIHDRCAKGTPPAFRMNCDGKVVKPKPKPKPNPKPNPSGCKDDNDNCPSWRSYGYCDSNPEYMHHHCKLSCNTCKGVSNCVNKNRHCNSWVRLCKSNGYMKANCRKACGTCS